MTDRVPAALRAPLALAGRLLVGAVLVYAGATKAAGPTEEFAYVISAYGILPPDATSLAALVLPWVEVFVGWALILGWQVRLSASAACGLFGAFLFALVGTKARGIELPNCGCFGDGIHFTMSQTIGFDSVLLLLSWLARGLGPGPAALDAWARGGYTKADAR